METTLKRFGASVMTVLLLASATMLPSCANRVRTAELDIASSDIEQHFANLGAFVTASDTTGGIATQFFNSAAQIDGESGSTKYYSEAPGDLGPMKTAMPLNWGELFPDGVQPFTPAKAYAFFVINRYSDGFHGSLIITNVDFEGNPPAGEAPFVFIAGNDGQMTVPGTSFLLYPGESTDEAFVMELSLNNRAQLIIRSTDISDGDLAEVIQLDVTRREADGSEYWVGKINLVPQT
jgi:hypothetical protein